MDINNINVLVLAYLGDNVYEYYVRRYLINKNIPNVDLLQKESINYVSAKKQSEFLLSMMEKNILTEEEIDIMKRARNHKGSRHPKNCDIVTYKNATGFEAIFGYLELLGKRDRIEELMDIVLGGTL